MISMAYLKGSGGLSDEVESDGGGGAVVGVGAHDGLDGLRQQRGPAQRRRVPTRRSHQRRQRADLELKIEKERY